MFIIVFTYVKILPDYGLITENFIQYTIQIRSLPVGLTASAMVWTINNRIIVLLDMRYDQQRIFLQFRKVH